MVAAGWSEAQKRAYVLADNQLAITGSGWDPELLRLELGELKLPLPRRARARARFGVENQRPWPADKVCAGAPRGIYLHLHVWSRHASEAR
jgi:hypothetical protein